jgi:Ca-activated chloride channel family protein
MAMSNRSVNKFLVVVVASGLVIASCSSDDDRAGGDQASSNTEADADAGTRKDDAEDFVADEPAVEATVEASADTEAPADGESSAQDNYTVDAEGRLADEAQARGEAADVDSSEGGLFEPGPSDVETPEQDESFNDSRFEDYGYRDFIPTERDALSTFALDVDTGAFTIGRRALESGTLPPRESVRPEEYINAFDYDYSAPRSGLDISVDGGPSPFDTGNHLVRIGVQAEIVNDEDRGPAALTFVIDTSGSMARPDRLGLVKESLILLVNELNDDDTVAIVTYSDDSGVVLNPTPVSDKFEIIAAIDELGPGGSTNLEAGLREGYDLAREAFQRDGINRVILASDGVANAGQTDPDALAAMIRDDADRGINLVTVGYGMGDFNDVTMEQLADQGDGFYAYVDTKDEAERLFEEELTSTLLTVAKDAKIQVKFDRRFVEAYRLIGFENRGVSDSDFRDDDVDAGRTRRGASGHSDLRD